MQGFEGVQELLQVAPRPAGGSQPAASSIAEEAGRTLHIPVGAIPVLEVPVAWVNAAGGSGVAIELVSPERGACRGCLSAGQPAGWAHR